MENADVASQGGANRKSGGTAAGLWVGTITYSVINGTAFQTPMQVSVSPSLDRVTTVAGQSGADTVAAHRSGSAVSWSILGSSMVTEVTLQPIQDGKARVTSRVIENGKILANGSGVFVNRG